MTGKGRNGNMEFENMLRDPQNIACKCNNTLCLPCSVRILYRVLGEFWDESVANILYILRSGNISAIAYYSDQNVSTESVVRSFKKYPCIPIERYAEALLEFTQEDFLCECGDPNCLVINAGEIHKRAKDLWETVCDPLARLLVAYIYMMFSYINEPYVPGSIFLFIPREMYEGFVKQAIWN